MPTIRKQSQLAIGGASFNLFSGIVDRMSVRGARNAEYSDVVSLGESDFMNSRDIQVSYLSYGFTGR